MVNFRLPSTRAGLLLLAAAVTLAACGSDPDAPPESNDAGVGEGPQVLFDPTLGPKRGNAVASWLAYPFPADHRSLETGKVRLTDFPNPDKISLIDNYLQTGERELDGFGLNGAVHMIFDAPLDKASIPADPGAYLSAQAPMQLVDITPASPEYGRRRPLRWEVWEKTGRFVWGGTGETPESSFAVAPTWGFPLRERTTYALIITRDIKGADGNPLSAPPLLKALLAAEPSAPEVKPAVPADLYAKLLAEFAPLRDRLALDGIDPATVAVATVFTTQSVTKDLAAIRNQIQGMPPPAIYDWYRPRIEGAVGPAYSGHFQWKSGSWVDYLVMEGSFDSWNYQQGEVPYASGGALNFVNGQPRPARTERLHFVLSYPRTPPAGGGCYPIVEVAHGTGGDAYTFFWDETAGRLAARGMAAISIDQPMHGLRAEGKDFNVEEMSFNYLNPESSRANFRQSAIDTFALTRFIKGSLKVPADISPTRQDLCFKTDRIGFFGHSHGGLTGAIAAAYEHDVGTWVFSGAGGGLAITVTERKDLVDIKALLSEVLGLGQNGNELLSELHPVMSLIQTLVDVTDPINYAPYWIDRDTFGRPANVMLTSGLHDEQTPYRTAIALALAARLPVVAPLAVDIPEYGWAGIAVASAPVQANVPLSAATKSATAGFLQWRNDLPNADYDSHFLIYYRPEAIHASMRFLQSGVVDGAAVIERVPGIDAR